MFQIKIKAILYTAQGEEILEGQILKKVGEALVIDITEMITNKEKDELDKLVGQEIQLTTLDEINGLSEFQAMLSSITKNHATIRPLERVFQLDRRGSLKIKINQEIWIMEMALPAADSLDFGKKVRWEQLQDRLPLKARLRDISAGGTCLLSQDLFEVGDTYIFDFPVDEDTYIPLKALILRKKPTPQEDLVLYGCQFVDLTAAAESAIMGFMFQEQKRNREKYVAKLDILE